MDTAKIKAFFVNHVEKMILSVVIVVSGFLVFQGFKLQHFTDENDPNQLTQRARQVKSQIDENRTEAIVADRIPSLDVVARTEALDSAVDPTPYKLNNPLQRKGLRSVVRRQDPHLKPPQSIINTTVVTTIGWQNRDPGADPDDYPLFALDPADPIDESGKPTSKTTRSRDRRSGGRNDEDEDEDDVLPGGGLDMGSLRGGIDTRPDSNLANTGSRRFSDANNFGVGPQTVDGHPPIPKVVRFIAGTAVVPHKDLYEAYKLALQDADAYMPGRDTPIYANFEVQRADVTNKPVDQLTEEDWSYVWFFKDYRDVAAKLWAGYAPEIVPAEYRDDRLSNWIPPVLLDDYRQFVTHPLIPMVSPYELEQDESIDETAAEEVELFGDNRAPVIAPGSSRGLGSMRGGGASQGLSSLGRGGSGGGSSGLSSLGGRTSGRGLSSGPGSEQEEDPVDYKLIRFYDFQNFGRKPPKLGAKYVYRIRFSVVDPNFPADRELQPRFSSLAPEVAKRVLALNDEATKTGIRKYQRWSPWSAPSDPVSLPALSQQFVGPVDPGSVYVWSVAGKQVEYARSVPQGTVVSSQYNEDYAVRVPFLLSVSEGSVLSHQADASVVDPISMEIKKLPDAKVYNDTTVIDLSGGAPLKLVEEMNEPGMMLLYDQDGKLVVADEVDDLEFYRIYSYADERGE